MVISVSLRKRSEIKGLFRFGVVASWQQSKKFVVYYAASNGQNLNIIHVLLLLFFYNYFLIHNNMSFLKLKIKNKKGQINKITIFNIF